MAIAFTLLAFALFLLMLVALRGTVFELSLKRNNFVGLILVRDIFLLTVPGVLLVNWLGTRRFTGLDNVSAESVPYISFYILVALAAFLVTVGALSRHPALSDLRSAPEHAASGYDSRLRALTTFFLAYGICLLVSLYFIFDVKHALFSVLLGDYESIKVVRLENRHQSGGPSVIFSLLQFICSVSAVLLGSRAFDGAKLIRFGGVMIVLVLATLEGAKAPPFNALLLFLLSYLGFHKVRLSLRTVLSSAVVAVGFIYLLFYSVQLQYPEFDFVRFLEYLFNRVGVGQVGGVYEEYNLKIRDWAYGWHAVPFANQALDYPIFHRDLMIVSERVDDPTSTGVKNSLFLAEAYGIGGPVLAALSPIIVGISFALSYCVFSWYWRRLFVADRFANGKIASLLFASFLSLTGGFSEWPLFKGVMLLLIFTTVCWLPYAIVRTCCTVRVHRAPAFSVHVADSASSLK
ncbi:MAG TPA: hypothetical protein VF193_04205 [Steroidobacter sp.]